MYNKYMLYLMRIRGLVLMRRRTKYKCVSKRPEQTCSVTFSLRNDYVWCLFILYIKLILCMYVCAIIFIPCVSFEQASHGPECLFLLTP